MKLNCLPIVWLTTVFVLTGCDQQEASQTAEQKTQVEQKQAFKGIKQDKKPLSLREQKTGEFFSSKMLPIAELEPETNQDIYIHLTGQVVNTNNKQTWAVVQGGNVAYFAFNHAGMPKIKKEYLGKQIYLRAILEEVSLSEEILVNIRNNGLAPGFATENIVKGYQLNTTKAALVDAVDEKTFMQP